MWEGEVKTQEHEELLADEGAMSSAFTPSSSPFLFRPGRCCARIGKLAPPPLTRFSAGVGRKKGWESEGETEGGCSDA